MRAIREGAAKALRKGNLVKAAILVAVALILAALGACAPDRAEFESDEAFEDATADYRAAKDERRERIRALALDRIEAYNAAGVDPLQLGPVALLTLESACLAAGVLAVEVEAGTGAGNLIDVPGVEAVGVSEDISAICQVASKAARAAVPGGAQE